MCFGYYYFLSNCASHQMVQASAGQSIKTEMKRLKLKYSSELPRLTYGAFICTVSHSLFQQMELVQESPHWFKNRITVT